MPAARLDPFATRLLAIHRQNRSTPPPTTPTSPPPTSTDAVLDEAHDALDAATAPLEPSAAETRELNPLPVESTGCHDCGGSEAKANTAVEELRQEIASMKERLAALEAQVAQLEYDTGPQFR